MKRVSRRQFAKLAGGAALALPLVPALSWPQEAAKKPEPAAPPVQQPAEAPKPEPKPKLTPKQEEVVQKAIERRDRQLTGLRSRTLSYDAEPTFVFQVRLPAHGRKRPSN